MRHVSLLYCIAALLLLSGCGLQNKMVPPKADTPDMMGESKIVFREMAAEAGINYRWKMDGKPVHNILDMMGNGCAFLDYDNDGNLDILLVGNRLALYRGDGKGHFTDVTQAMGLAKLHGHFLGCATGDYDRDGFTELYITAYQGGVLLHNIGGKGFEDVTAKSGIAKQPWATSAAWGDLHGDGKLDLVIGNYVHFLATTNPQLCKQKGMLTACAPRDYLPEPVYLYRGDGKGHFTDVTKATGFDKLAGKALGIAMADYDNSGHLSVSIANDEMQGDLMKNRGGGRFQNIAKMAGTATDNDGNFHGGMGTAWGDVDGDGRLDLLVATYQNEVKNIYHNDGGDLFADKGAALGLTSASPFVTFGAQLADFDNDGILDIVLANGHVQDNIAKIDARTTFLQPTLFFHGGANGRFTNIGDSLDKVVTKPIMGRGLAVGDFDNDGRVDLLVVDSNGAPLLLHNETRNAGHFLGITLKQPGNQSVAGATVTLKIAGDAKTIVRHCHTDGSYMSASDPRILFGLGSAIKVERVNVAWIGGGKDTYTDLPIDRYITLTRGKK